MLIEEAILGRRSIRAFRSDPVPPALLREIVEAARWVPSAANTQPWEFTIVGGERLQTLRTRLRETVTADPVGKPEMGWPPNLPERFKERRLEIGKATFEALGIAADDKARKGEWFLFGIGFFDAPQVIVLSMERCFSDLGVLDMGAVALALMLLAHGKGLGTCPQAAPLRYPWLFHEVLGIPETKRVMLAIPIGYPVTEAPVNRFARTRVPVEKCLAWSGIVPATD
ncbi:MAG TPA: nitroreductase [Candidatus Methylomirabilis sp.]|nr:nitroreductase [Candidatus Methylomirabilis sp.]HSB81881.1 nitroreductase [Candidatus Methylomirabilis sp.]